MGRGREDFESLRSSAEFLGDSRRPGACQWEDAHKSDASLKLLLTSFLPPPH